MARAAVGFRAHTGWAAAVTLVRTRDRPVVVDRRRIDLLAKGVPWEVYHAARKRGGRAAETLIDHAIEATDALALRTLRALVDELRAGGHELVASGVVLSTGRPPFTLEEALRSHASVHGAEGHLYRQSLVHASGVCGLRVAGVAERDLYGHASSALGLQAHALRSAVGELGREMGAPWGADQKNAALVAWIALEGRRQRMANG